MVADSSLLSRELLLSFSLSEDGGDGGLMWGFLSLSFGLDLERDLERDLRVDLGFLL